MTKSRKYTKKERPEGRSFRDGYICSHFSYIIVTVQAITKGETLLDISFERFARHLHRGLKKYETLRQEGDLLIILGDVGLAFPEHEGFEPFTERFLALPYPIAFIDGDHENFDFLNSFPEEDFCGGRVHRLTENIVHLMRGYIFEIEGKSILTMGVCESTKGWWDRGLASMEDDPNEEEISRAYNRLRARKEKVDYVLTHKYKLEIGRDRRTLVGLTEHIERNVDYKTWYSGHWHATARADEKHCFVYNEQIPLI